MKNLLVRKIGEADPKCGVHSMRRTFPALLLLLTAAAALAADAPPVAIHARRLLDVRSGTTSEAWIVVRGNRIDDLAKSAPPGMQVIDLGNATVLPGLIDCHVHLEADWNDFSATG